MNLFKEIEQIYKDGIQYIDGKYVCPVCKKEYVRETSAQKHYDKQTCFSYRNLFEGSIVETKFFSIYKFITGLENKRGYGFRKFKQSRYYTDIAKFYIFCLNNNIDNHDQYLEYVMLNSYCKTPLKCLYAAQRESTKQQYIEWCRLLNEENRNESFFESYKKYLGEDTEFTLRSLERGDIHCEYLFDRIDFDVFVSKLTKPETIRLEHFLNSMMESK